MACEVSFAAAAFQRRTRRYQHQTLSSSRKQLVTRIKTRRGTVFGPQLYSIDSPVAILSIPEKRSTIHHSRQSPSKHSRMILILRNLAIVGVLWAPRLTASWTSIPSWPRKQYKIVSNSFILSATDTDDENKQQSSSKDSRHPPLLRTTPSEEERPHYAIPRPMDESLVGDMTGGRPGAIIETEEQLEIKQQILDEIANGSRSHYPSWMEDYGELQQDEEAEYDVDDPDAMDAATLGTWTIQDIRSRFEYEWDPTNPESIDPNLVALNQPGTRYVEETTKDDDGVELGYDPIFGPSSPMDRRTILGAKESYMIDEQTKNEQMLEPLFKDPKDPEIEFNENIVQFRKSLDMIETFIDPFLSSQYLQQDALQDEDLVRKRTAQELEKLHDKNDPKYDANKAVMEVPRHVAKWHGYPEQTFLEPKNYTNNRFTKIDELTDFDSMTPFRARQRAVELARSQNAEWMPRSVSYDFHVQQRQPYENYQTLVGTLRKAPSINPTIVEMIQPALQILGSCVELLSIDEIDLKDDKNKESKASTGLVFRFAYHGLMKNKHGMKAWTQTMLDECFLNSSDDDDESGAPGGGLRVTGVIFETGFRRRDAPYDGGDPYYGPSAY